MDPMHQAISRRRGKHLDMALIVGKDPQPGHAPDGNIGAEPDPNYAANPKNLSASGRDGKIEPTDKDGDLAPNVDDDIAADASAGKHSPAEERAMHAKAGDRSSLQGELKEHFLNNPEHQPLPRNNMVQDAMGHEEAIHDPDFEQMMQSGHNSMLQRPKTLGARVAAAISAKKGRK
jgi:hypothetical protein